LDISWNLCTFAICSRDDQWLERPLRRLLTLSAEHNLANFREVAECVEGIRLARRGEEVGVARFQAGYAVLSAAGVRIYMPLFVAEHARSLLGFQRHSDARNQINLALDLLERTGERFTAAEIHQVDGQVYLAEGDRLAAETSFRRAVDVARLQEAKSWELRACTSLARLWADGGQRRRAYDLLAPVLDWFTEGFETVDLIECRRLLNELT
jgi:predicted ATPase